MMRAIVSGVALAVAACGGGGKGASGPGGSGSSGCPEDPRAAIVSKNALDGVELWVLHERIVPDEQDGVFGGEEYGKRVVGADVAAAHGVRTNDDPVWIFLRDDVPACKGTPGRWLAIRDGDGAYFTEIAREVTLDASCGPPPDAGLFLALRGDGVDPTCLFRARTDVVGRIDAEDPPLPPPPDIAKLAAPLDCDSPVCQLLWSEETMATAPGELGVSEVIVSAVQAVAGQDMCAWEVKDAHTFFLRHPGAPTARWDEAGLWAILRDRRGVRWILTSEPGVVELHAPGGPGQTPERRAELAWYIPHEEDGAYYSLGPYCGP